jgi:anti-sigma B factor antagonist
MMTLNEERMGDVVILTLSGKLMGGPDAGVLNNKLHELVEAKSTKVVANIADLNWMNSSGLGILIGGLNTMRNNQGDLKLAVVPARIQSLLTITKLHTIIEVYESVADAVASYA